MAFTLEFEAGVDGTALTPAHPALLIGQQHAMVAHAMTTIEPERRPPHPSPMPPTPARSASSSSSACGRASSPRGRAASRPRARTSAISTTSSSMPAGSGSSKPLDYLGRAAPQLRANSSAGSSRPPAASRPSGSRASMRRSPASRRRRKPRAGWPRSKRAHRCSHADDLAFWDAHGYVVLHDAVPREAAKRRRRRCATISARAPTSRKPGTGAATTASWCNISSTPPSKPTAARRACTRPSRNSGAPPTCG